MEYWSKAKDPTLDHENLLNLFQMGVLSDSLIIKTSASSDGKKFWDAFKNSIDTNIRGVNNKQRVLSIIADDFKYEELESELKVY